MNYTSPHTGIIYEVKETEHWYNEFSESGPTRREYTQYTFFCNGNLVTLTFNAAEKYLSDHFGVIEGIYTIPTSPRD